MPTDEERRKVAAEMRGYPAELIATLHPAEDALAYYVLDLMEIVGLEDGKVMGLFARLADLIEPEPERTCRMVLDEDVTSLLEYDEVFRCTSCGEEVVRKTGTTIRFCPMCRARVTDWVVPG